MKLEVETLKKEDEKEYSDFLLKCPNALAQHTLEWREVIKSFEGEKDYYLIAKKNGRIVGILPAFIYQNKYGNILQSSSYPGSYGGIVSNFNDLEKTILFENMTRVLTEISIEQNCILATICTSPFSYDFSLYKKYLEPDYIKDNFYQYIDLQDSYTTDKEKGIRGKIRTDLWRNIKKSYKYDLEIIESDKLEDLKEWYQIYDKRMTEIEAKPLPSRLFESSLKYMLKKNRAKFFYVKHEDKIISGAFLTCLKDVIDDFMGSMDTNYAFTQANAFLFYNIISWAKEKGFKYYNWQSSPSKESNIYHYKKGWGSDEDIHYYLTKAFNDITEFKTLPLSLIKKEYEWHYVMPYEEFKNKS